MHTHTFTHTHTRTFTHTDTHTFTHVYTLTHTHTHTRILTHTLTHIHTHAPIEMVRSQFSEISPGMLSTTGSGGPTHWFISEQKPSAQPDTARPGALPTTAPGLRDLPPPRRVGPSPAA